MRTRRGSLQDRRRPPGAGIGSWSLGPDGSAGRQRSPQDALRRPVAEQCGCVRLRLDRWAPKGVTRRPCWTTRATMWWRLPRGPAVSVTLAISGDLDAGDLDTVSRLAELATGHSNPLVREAAVAALGATGHPEGLDAILAATTDRVAVRRRAVLALAPFDGPGSGRCSSSGHPKTATGRQETPPSCWPTPTRP